MWRNHRKLLDPAFNNNIIKSFLSIFNEKSVTFVKVMEKHLDGRAFDLFEMMSALSLDNILTTSTGLRKEIQTEKSHIFLEHCLE